MVQAYLSAIAASLRHAPCSALALRRRAARLAAFLVLLLNSAPRLRAFDKLAADRTLRRREELPLRRARRLREADAARLAVAPSTPGMGGRSKASRLSSVLMTLLASLRASASVGIYTYTHY